MCQVLRDSNRRRGLTLVEVVIAVALLVLLSLITVTGMVFHARTAASNLHRQRIAENARNFQDAVQIAALDATIIRIDTGPAGDGTVLTIGKPDPNTPGATIFRQFAYLDDDGNPNTIEDNRIVMRDTNTPNATTGKMLVQYVSPVAGTNVFTQATNTLRPLYRINLHVGDRSRALMSEDNRLTGPGYQGFRIALNVSQL